MMSYGLELEIDAFSSVMNKKLNEIEARATEILPLTSRFNGNSKNTLSTMSLVSVDIPPTPREMNWDKFEETINSDPEEAVLEVITYLKNRLDQKASTKRMTEKAKNQYVDSTFRRVSTQVTAMVNQSILQNHTLLENEISYISNEIDGLKELMVREFDEIHQIIQECKILKEQVQKDDYQNYYQSQIRSRYHTSANQRHLNSQANSKHYQNRKSSSALLNTFSASLTNSFKKEIPKKP